MLRALNLIQNIGKFDNVSAGRNLPFERLTIVYAENARGKSTLAAIMRSAASGQPQFITERTRLGATHQPRVIVDTGAGVAIFSNGAWSQTMPDIAVFDDAFVAENVCSGIDVGSSQRANLHELIVGAHGITLTRSLQREVDRIEIHNRALRERESSILAQIRNGMSVDAFCALRPIDSLPRQIEEATRRLAAARDAGRVAETPLFAPLTLSKIDLESLEPLLGRSVPDLDQLALARVQEHIARLGHDGEEWVGRGMELSDQLIGQGHDECPFCVQPLSGSPILGLYRAYFGEAYEELKREITSLAQDFQRRHAGDVPAAFERSIREAVERQGFWRSFAEIPSVNFDTAAVARLWKTAREHFERLVEAKRNSPLDVIEIPAEARVAVAAFNAQCDRLSGMSDSFLAANPSLERIKEQARDANVPTLANDLANLRAVESRYEPTTAALCEAYEQEKAAKAITEQRRTAARTALDQHRQTAFPAYGLAINDFLQRFNASFRVGPVDPVNTRGGSAANYTLLVEGHPVPLSANPGAQSFRNTLSAGDRNTLALAFFFASLQMDPLRVQKFVVIDDPMTSLDEHRTLHTLQEMDRLARDVAGMIVLSHSKPFLLGVWDKIQQMPKASIEVRRHGAGSTLAAWDVTGDMVTEHDRRFASAMDYIQQSNPAMERRVAESLRPMMEAYCRVAYPTEFPPGTLLGPFQAKCMDRLAGTSPIMSRTHATELRALLDYSNRFHHDTNPAYATELINDAELTDFARRTLAFIQRP